MNYRNQLFIIGLSSQRIADEKIALLHTCKTVFSASKFHRYLRKILNENVASEDIRPITPVAHLPENVQMALQHGNVAVLASGDPLFYGIGKQLISHFDTELVNIYPDLSYMQIAFSRFMINWDDAEIISLHGRKGEDLSTQLHKNKICFFTDDINTPHRIANFFQESDRSSSYTMHIAENLSFENEYLFSGSLDEVLSHRPFVSPNIAILIRHECSEHHDLPVLFGLKESQLYHSRGLITKNEIRAVAIHQLALPSTGVLWDVGGGSGSVSIEASGIAPELHIYCVEKKEEEQKNIILNRTKYSRSTINLVKGEAPTALETLPSPDRIFIGGSGGHLKDILDYCCCRLNKGGKIVINCVLKKSAELAPKLLFDNGLTVEISEIAINRTSYPKGESVEFNPITIVTGSR